MLHQISPVMHFVPRKRFNLSQIIHLMRFVLEKRFMWYQMDSRKSKRKTYWRHEARTRPLRYFVIRVLSSDLLPLRHVDL